MKITIVSATYNSINLLYFNHGLISNFLDGVDFDWIVVDNSNEMPDDRFISIEGVPRPNIPTFAGITASSHQHGMSLNKALEFIVFKKIKSDFILIIDPDFFLLTYQTPVIDHIVKNNLSFFGVDYVDYDKRPRSVRGFPIAYCMYINTSLVDISKLNFKPEKRQSNQLLDVGHQVSESFFNSSHKFEVVNNLSLDDMSKTLNVKINKNNIYTKNMEIYTWNSKNFGLHLHCRQIRFDPFLINNMIS